MATITDSIGRVLAGRYRIESALGTGASAHVFAAWDVSLRRRVAVKVLHPALAGDAAFLRRFKAEAQAAASLTHPHVIGVYDWGEDGNGPFLVLEFLGGGSLRDLLDNGRRLTVPQALQVGAQAAEALAYAHGRGFVHRDVKPANLLFAEDASLRVADFGVARALAEAAWTEPAGAMLGTARYAAPEQATGRPVDGRADVYALALVLYEAVTGVVPFAADTTLSTLMGRVGVRLPGHDALGPLAAVLEAAAAPEPEERLDAAALAGRLRGLTTSLPAPQPLPLAGPGGNGMPQFAPGPVGDDLTELGVSRGEDVGAASGSGADTRAAASAAAMAGRRRRLLLAGAVVAAVLLVGGAAYGVVASKLFVASHPLARITGDSTTRAAEVLRGEHMTLQVVGHRSSTTVPAGDVIREIPGAGTALKEGSVVGVVVSSGPPPVAVPSLASITGGCAQVESALAAARLRAACTTQASTSVANGAVISWSPKEHAPLGSTVTVTVSSGPPLETIPSLTGSTCDGATTTLRSIGLVADCQQTYSTGVPTGQVVSWNPTQQAPEGSTVTVEISKGPPPVVVPPIYGHTVSQAINMLEAAGLVPGTDQGPLGGHVFASNPPEGATVPEGTTVTIYSQ
ncbi:MAG: Stk1 family PASTA domain-containing Ser/Thr kinase [Acidimicrobiales bacterium]